METQYCQRATEIRSDKITTTRELLDAMKGVVPTDAQFQKAFEAASVSKSNLARYYLRVLENQITGKLQPELVPNNNEDIITLEHVLPENPSIGWDSIDADLAAAYYRRIGNMALLTRKINSHIGNAGFVAKRLLFSQSDYQLTKQIAAYTEWNPSKIDERQRILARFAIQAWPNKV